MLLPQRKGEYIDIREELGNRDVPVAKGTSLCHFCHFKSFRDILPSFHCSFSSTVPSHLVFAPQVKHRIAHKPNSMPKVDAVLDLREPAGEEDGGEEDEGGAKCVMTEEELWARLDELEKLEAMQDEQDR